MYFNDGNCSNFARLLEISRIFLFEFNDCWWDDGMNVNTKSKIGYLSFSLGENISIQQGIKSIQLQIQYNNRSRRNRKWNFIKFSAEWFVIFIYCFSIE